MALSESVVRDCYAPGPPSETYTAAASVAFYQGSIVAIDTADGLLKLGAVSTTLKVLGVSAREYDTTGVAAEDRLIPVDHGTFGDFESATGGGDDIAENDIKKPCYVVDDDTVALTDGGATRSLAGTIHGVTAEGRVIVQFEVVR